LATYNGLCSSYAERASIINYLYMSTQLSRTKTARKNTIHEIHTFMSDTFIVKQVTSLKEINTDQVTEMYILQQLIHKDYHLVA